MRNIIFTLLLLFSFISCRTTKHLNRVITDSTEVAIPITNTKIEYRDRLIYDSIYTYDSIYLYIKGDTVFKYKEKINTRFINKTDTITRVDTIKVPITTTKKTSNVTTEIQEINKLYWWQKFLMWIGVISIFVIMGFAIYKVKFK